VQRWLSHLLLLACIIIVYPQLDIWLKNWCQEIFLVNTENYMFYLHALSIRAPWRVYFALESFEQASLHLIPSRLAVQMQQSALKCLHWSTFTGPILKLICPSKIIDSLFHVHVWHLISKHLLSPDVIYNLKCHHKQKSHIMYTEFVHGHPAPSRMLNIFSRVLFIDQWPSLHLNGVHVECLVYLHQVNEDEGRKTKIIRQYSEMI